MKKLFAYGVLISGLILGLALVAFPQTVSQLAGLAVAQTTTKWNKVIDAARGDSQANGILGQALYMFNGVTFDRQRGTIAGGADVAIKSVSGGVTPSDAFTNPTNALTTYALNGVFNGTTWDRTREVTADAMPSTGLLASPQLIFNGATWDRARTLSGDGQSGTGLQASIPGMLNAAGFDRLRGVGSTENTAATSRGTIYHTPLSTWSVVNTQAGAVQATASKAAGGGTVRHVATSVTLCRGDTVAAAPALIHLRDGATGAGTIIRSWVIGVSAINESTCQNLSGLNMTGSANTAMTIEFAAAGAATSTSTVTLTGYSTP